MHVIFRTRESSLEHPPLGLQYSGQLHSMFGPLWICCCNCELSSGNAMRNNSLQECIERNMQVCSKQKPVNSNLINKRTVSIDLEFQCWEFQILAEGYKELMSDWS